MVYGLVKPLASFNPLWAQVHYWVQLARICWEAPRWSDKVRIWFKPPPWMPREMPAWPPPPEVRPETFRKYDPPVSPGRSQYVFAQLVLCLCATTVVLFNDARLPTAFAAAASAWLVGTLVNCGGVFEGRAWAFPLELARLAILPAVAWFASPPLAGVVAVGCAANAVWAARVLRSPARELSTIGP